MRADQIIDLGPGSRKAAGEAAKSFIISDANKGIFQNGEKNISYSNKGAGVGWRTIGKGDKAKRIFIDCYINFKKRGMEIPGYGRLKQYQAASLDRGKLGKVNARLTSETLRRITAKEKTGNILFELNYERGEVVLGLKDQKKADVYDLSDENKTRVVNILMKEISRKANKYMAQDIKIKIGK